jgi:5-methylcytosine-specific restriction endonuclease McrA
MVMKKICTKCGINKALEDFYEDSRHKDGRQSECKSCHKLAQAKYDKSDKGKLRDAKYEKSDKGKLTRAKYAKSDKGKLRDAKYMKTDKGKATVARKNSKSRYWKSKTINTLNDKEFNYIVFTAQNNKCACCGRTFTDELKATRDHIYPVSKGGDFTKETVQALCQSCNSKKNTKYIDYRTDNHKEMIRNYGYPTL